MTDPPRRLSSLLAELKRRKVVGDWSRTVAERSAGPLIAARAPILALWLLLSPTPTPAQEEHHCREAHSSLVEEAGMTAITEADTIDDWRSQAMVPGCRVTASGLTTRTQAAEARSFYEAVRAAGWTRTPDPMDAPNEASLRFRKDGSDCLFNFYSGGLLGTEAEATVENAVVPGPGEQRYNFLVLCMAAREAAAR